MEDPRRGVSRGAPGVSGDAALGGREGAVLLPVLMDTESCRFQRATFFSAGALLWVPVPRAELVGLSAAPLPGNTSSPGVRGAASSPSVETRRRPELSPEDPAAATVGFVPLESGDPEPPDSYGGGLLAIGPDCHHSGLPTLLAST